MSVCGVRLERGRSVKTWADLSEEQRTKAIEGEIENLVTEILQGLRFNDKLNRDDLQAGVWRDNCPNCEGTGQVIDFKKIRVMTLAQKETSNG